MKWTTPQLTELCAVAGIIDVYGGMRVLVTEPWRVRHHVSQGEYLFVVPDFMVTEPIKWEHIPFVIARVENYLIEWFRGRNDPDIDMPLKQYEIRCIKSRPQRSLDTSTLVWA